MHGERRISCGSPCLLQILSQKEGYFNTLSYLKMYHFVKAIFFYEDAIEMI
jgi:hypothetical protein